MTFYDYLTRESNKRNIGHITENAPNETLKKCKYAVDELEIDPGLIFLDLEIGHEKGDYSGVEPDIIRLVKQKRSNTENMINILNREIDNDNKLIDKFKKEQDIDTTEYINFLEECKKNSENEYNYLVFLLSKHVDWLKENS